MESVFQIEMKWSDLPDFQMQHQKAAVSDVLEGSGEVSQCLEDLLSIADVLAVHLSI